jgi:hypothetical protein
LHVRAGPTADLTTSDDPSLTQSWI